jgi:hypothetical protein
MTENLDASTAKTYATVGLIFYALSILSGILGLFTLNWGLARTNIPHGPWGSWPSIPALIGFGIGLLFLANVVLALWAYKTYKQIDDGRYMEAQTGALLLGIFGLVFGGFIGGLFFLLTYAKIGDIQKKAQWAQFPPTQGVAGERYCISCRHVVYLTDKFCPKCGTQLPE